MEIEQKIRRKRNWIIQQQALVDCKRETYAAPCMLNQASNSASRSSIIDNGDA
jgi:hypothetical protein